MSKQIVIPQTTRADQLAASNPDASAWVSANAGSGKTHVLTQRVIRLMLAGNAPDRILCLTFTKAAAAEMKKRVFETLAKWTMMADDDLDTAIQDMSGKPASAKHRQRARQLFARALDTPGGLKIQTIHAFCEALLHQFPLEANVPGHFETLQDTEQLRLLEIARRDVLSNSNEAAGHYAALVDYASDAAIEDGLNAVIAMRESFRLWINNGVDTAIEKLCETVGLSPQDTTESVHSEIISTFSASKSRLLDLIGAVGEGKGASDQRVLEALDAVVSGQPPDQTLSLLRKALLKKDDTVRDKDLVTKAVWEPRPDVKETLIEFGVILQAGLDKIRALRLLTNSAHLFKIAREVLARYEHLKHTRGAIDFDDQIQKCASLLNRAHIREWIRYRLDRGIDHVLVDEAQDTSPAQWQVINAIVEDFHVGETASLINRTVFVVGDEKQSIYSFQGARPAEFASQRHNLKTRTMRSDSPYHPGSLNLSFRSTQDVLKAVDKVFESPENAAGLVQDGEAPPHDAIRKNDPGEVQIWPLFEKREASEPENWLDPVDRAEVGDPALKLAARITDTIGEWVGKPLPGTGKPIKYGDILVLVRSRDRFSAALVRAMKDAGHSVAGADRLKLTEHIAVEDLLALGRVVLLPEDDLSLAAVLKSPFFGLDEDELYDIAQPRKKLCLYHQIQTLVSDDSYPLAKIANQILTRIDQFISLGRQAGVFEFYARVLGEFGGRKAILARLGGEAEDVIDAFLDETLEVGRAVPEGLEAFIARLSDAQPEIKREVDLERDEVRVLTVHSAKGLEAPVVFLVDSCKPVWTEAYRPKVMNISDNENQPAYLWMAESALHITATRARVETIRSDAEAEYRRLLYVGMTRAADRLVICGYKGAREINTAHWHSMVSNALVEDAQELRDEIGEISAWRWIYREGSAVIADADEVKPSRLIDPETPAWLFERVKPEPPLPRPLTPSGAFALIDRNAGMLSPRLPTRSGHEADRGLERGNVTHRLLEVLPNLAPEQWQVSADNYLDRAAANWDAKERRQIRDSVIAILEQPAFSDLYGEGSSAEVTLAGRIEIPSGPRLVTGQIDRLVVLDDRVVIVDYKTSRVVPDRPDEVAHENLAQLALYRELVRQIYPNHNVVAALLWTRVPEMMVIPDAFLDHALAAIKKG